MSPYKPKPHVSAAIVQLRRWVTLTALVLTLCALSQMLVYGFVQYTDVRHTEIRPVKSDKPSLRVVAPTHPIAPAHQDPVAVAIPGIAPAPAHLTPHAGSPLDVSLDAAAASPEQPLPPESLAAGAPAEARQTVVGGIRGRPALEAEPKPEPVDVNRVGTSTDKVMARLSNFACAAGIIASIALVLITMLGVAVAGGAAVPGVEKVVTSCVWSMALGMLCLPWSRLMPDLGVPGLFVGYEAMTTAVEGSLLDGHKLGTAATLAQWVVAPGIVLFISLGVCLWFRSGVDRGVIVTAPSELDKAVDRELELIHKRGVASATPKSVGALNRAIGDSIDQPTERPLNAVERAIEQAARSAASLMEDAASAVSPKRNRSVVDADYKRPI